MKKISLQFLDGFVILGSAIWITDNPNFAGKNTQSLIAWLSDFDENGVIEDIDIDVDRYADSAFRLFLFKKTYTTISFTLHLVSRKVIEREKKRLRQRLAELENFQQGKKKRKM